MFLTLFFILARLSLLLSNFLTPTRLKVSTMSPDLIFVSKGESVARDGERFTSINHGLFKIKNILYLLKIWINEDIKSKQLKAIVLVRQFLKVAIYDWVYRKDRLNYDIVYLRPEQVQVNAYLFKVHRKCSQAPFVPRVVLLGIHIRNVLVVLFVDGVVG